MSNQARDKARIVYNNLNAGTDPGLTAEEAVRQYEEDIEVLIKALTSTLPVVWTDTKPTEPGWYWYKGLVWGNKVTKMLELCRDPLSRSLYSAIWGGYVDMMDGQWAGPINPPEAP